MHGAKRRRDAGGRDADRAGAHRVIDMGCGQPALCCASQQAPGVQRSLSGSMSRVRCAAPAMPQRVNERFTVRQSALTYADQILVGYDAAVLMEVVEHVDESRLPALERSVFGCAKPNAATARTTPNAEYNVRFATLPSDLPTGYYRFELTPVPRGRGRRRTSRLLLSGYRPRRSQVGPRLRPRCSRWSGEHPDSRHVAGRAHRRIRFGQADIRAQALHTDRGAVQRLLPRSRRRRRDRPVGDDGRLRRAALRAG